MASVNGTSTPSRCPMPRTNGEVSHNAPASSPARAPVAGPNSSKASANSTNATPAVSASGTSRDVNVTDRRSPADSWALMKLAA